MKCKICGGTGTSNTCVNGTFKPCSFCDGTGEYEPFDADVELDKLYPIEQTHDEWRKTCSAEEFAEFLSNIEEQYPCGALLKCDVTCGYHSQCRGDDVAPTNKEAWVEWLKQPHTAK